MKNQQVARATALNAQEGDMGPTKVHQYRLTPTQYLELESKAIAGLRFRDDTGPVQSGFLNGVEHVLRLVRSGFTTQ